MFQALKYLLSQKDKPSQKRWLEKFKISAGFMQNDDEPFSNTFWEERGAVLIGGVKVPGKHGKDIILKREIPGRRRRLHNKEQEHKSNKLKEDRKGCKCYQVDFPVKTHDSSGRYYPGKILYQTLYDKEDKKNLVLCDVLFVIKRNVIQKKLDTKINASKGQYKDGQGQAYHITQENVKPICVIYLNDNLAKKVKGSKQFDQIKRMWNNTPRQKQKLNLQQIDKAYLKYL